MNTFFTPLTFGEVGTVLTNTHIKIIAKKQKPKKAISIPFLGRQEDQQILARGICGKICFSKLCYFFGKKPLLYKKNRKVGNECHRRSIQLFETKGEKV